MTVVAAMECFVHFFAEGLKVVLPTVGVGKVGVVGVKHEPHFVLQAPQHGGYQVAVFGKEAGVYPYMINQIALERIVQCAVTVA